MQVILLEANKNLGGLGAVVNVKAGYARNYLIPQGKARFATPANLEFFEKEKDSLIAKAGTLLEKAKKQAEDMADLVCTIGVNASEEGKLFGSVGTASVVKALADLGHEVEKRDINMPDGLIRQIGEYDINVRIHAEVSINIGVNVVVK